MNSLLMNKIFENTLKEGENSPLYSTEYDMEIQDLERKNPEYALRGK